MITTSFGKNIKPHRSASNMTNSDDTPAGTIPVMKTKMSAKTATKLDLFKANKTEYAAPRKPVLIQTQLAKYLTFTGQGQPGGPVFEAAIGALYSVAFTIKMTRKFAGHQDYAVSKLEAQWWGDTTDIFCNVPREQWRWKLMIRTPDFISPTDLTSAVSVLRRRGKGDHAEEVQLEEINEGTCVQMLHVGPYDREGDTVSLMEAFAEANHRVLTGKHHEIYISDPRRVPADRLKTILRVPVTGP
jgi:hypothetical protein